jgi:hypothetical protein
LVKVFMISLSAYLQISRNYSSPSISEFISGSPTWVPT